MMEKVQAKRLWARLLMWLGAWCCLTASAAPAPAPAWPPPPAAPCIVYVRDISGARDIGAKAPFLTRLADAITGSSSAAKKLSHPFGLSLDDGGNLMVTDTGANAVFFLDLAHKKWLCWTAVGGHRFLSPVAAVHHGKTFYVADTGWGKVIAFNEKGAVQFEITNGLARPAGLAQAGGRRFVVDSELHQVLIFDLNGGLISKFGQRGRGPGEFNFPTHVAVDDRQQIYITDSLNYRIQVFTVDGKYVREFGSAGDAAGHFSRPKGVAVDRAGHVYVVDAVFGNVQIFNESGRLLLDFGEAGPVPGEFCLPNAIAINANNDIFVADAYNHRLQMFHYTGRE